MTPKQVYLYDIEHQGFTLDPIQLNTVEYLDKLAIDIVEFKEKSLGSTQDESSIWNKITRFSSLSFNSNSNPFASKSVRSKSTKNWPRGLYLWGGVGRGKTYLMDLFFNSLNHPKKIRLHFHHFMQKVHTDLTALSSTSDPLETVADKFKQQADVICFDEFFVSDITDAMLLGTLFDALFRRGIVLVATSNIPPNELYRNGLQRERFLPAIELLNKNCQIIELDSDTDYRLRALEQAQMFHSPLNENTCGIMNQAYYKLTQQTVNQPLNQNQHSPLSSIEIQGRQIKVHARHQGVLYVSFTELCQTNRSALDYIEIAKCFHTVLLYGLPLIKSDQDDAARRFIAMVDEFYERKVNLMIVADSTLGNLYQGERLKFEFERCQSRLIEMQSVDYLSQQHLC